MSTSVDVTQKGWRRMVRNFSPSWFVVTMGTGVASILLFLFPYNARWIYWLSVIVFCLEIALFALAALISLLRYILWPRSWESMIHHPIEALFVAAAPMSFAQIITMIVYLCSPIWGPWATYAAWGMWMLDSAVSIVLTFYMPFLVMKQKPKMSLSSITALQMFPILATMVASGCGAVLAEVLISPHEALGTVIVSYVLWGLSLPIALIMIALYFQRLIIHKLPSREAVASVFIPIGPPSMGGLAAMSLGKTAMNVFPMTRTLHPLSGVVLYSVGVLAALVLWGFALFWLVLAVLTVLHSRPFPFNIGWWAFTFPLGLFANLSIKLGEELPSRFFKVVGAIVAVIVFLLWIMVAFGTIKNTIAGKLFVVPELRNVPSDEYQEKETKQHLENGTKDV